jgi:hypothetical protein
MWAGVLALVAVAAQDDYAGSQSCAPCHPEQVRAFRQTPMGRSLSVVTSAAAPEFNKPVQFFHPKTGRRYRIFRRQSEFLIEEFFLDQNRRRIYSDERSLQYAIGSGNHATSFLVERSGRLYQAPVTFFRRTGRWDMSPGYDTPDYVGFTRRVTANCLFCHAGRVNPRNQSGDLFDPAQPFLEMPIGCERCHGPGARHIANPGAAIVNPARLSPKLRDQVCEQCHLFGAARITQPGKSLADYRPGEPLGAVLAVYAYDGTAAQPALTGHPLEMKQSACRRESRDRLWCGSCHQAHTAVKPSASASFYRAKCFNCHARDACSRKPDPASTAHRNNNCIDCHMPKRPVIESAHVAFTDHRILRRPASDFNPRVSGARLIPILPEDLDDPVVASRNLGFAYADLAGSTAQSEFHGKVIDILRPLAGTTVAGAAFWQTLAEAHLARRDTTQAGEAFQEAAKADPSAAGAHYGLGYLFQRRGLLPDAIQAYRRALEADPDKAEALGNLAAAYSAMGSSDQAVRMWEAALRIEPGNLRWRALLESAKAK